jgi:hypothetical protein
MVRIPTVFSAFASSLACTTVFTASAWASKRLGV